MKILEIRKSKFIPLLFDVNSKEDVKIIIESLWKEHKKARHIVYAYIIKNDNVIINGYTDDREPKGVAGIPLYTFLNSKNLENKLLVVIRYFGGIELGKSNLLRTYLQAAKLLFDND
ncbi:YigZ family protein [Mycoplasmopsis arginini]|uniref:YigZ family protein n=1 Tax=Mycoplasmopsis arginini TaxID=2094 RepID=A0AA43U2M4_MYCAR|nr:YigZ family protein [Mycoplasmopsis arginini]MCY2903111.1 YigZ family protein [Mycoplasmopsis arginini QMP CG1-2758]MDI3349389.1 YigZ family protein [Mycoplasmopsis arginini]MDI3350215.1 YigZ family protein [Mycoplasmopsis arginini]MDI3350748.1 YigZ family protein [Mycoplasmopsis arginini]MDI3352349.1 YigZ family protein [Mycoplasmopsis arginini]